MLPDAGGPPRSRRAVDALVVMDAPIWALQFDDTRIRRLAALTGSRDPVWVPSLAAPDLTARLSTVEILVTGWGAPRLDEPTLRRMPRLRAVLHCAGSVRGIVSDAMWERGVVVSSSADLNAEPVVEYTLAAILMAGKKMPFLAMDARRHRADWSYRDRRGPLGNTGLVVGLVGFSRIGRRVAATVTTLLRDVTCLVADPLADPGQVSVAGATLVDLDAMLPRLDVLSLHAPELPSTFRMISADRLASLPDHCCVVNTARGSLLDTAALEVECASGRLHAILDVTDPEPLPAESPLYDLPNVMITPHVAGSQGAEARRMTDGALDELERLVEGHDLVRQVHREELDHSA